MKLAMKNYYQILEVRPNSSIRLIKAQWLLLLQAWHPDKFKNVQQKACAQEKTLAINEAYTVLADPKRRAQFDRNYPVVQGTDALETACGNRAGYSVEGEGHAKGRYLEVKLVEIQQNKALYCDTDCLWYPRPSRCQNKTNVALNEVYKTHLRYTEVILSIRNIFDYELYVSFENSCFIVDKRGNLYKRKYLFCDAFLRNKNRFLHTGEWLKPYTQASFLLSFPELSDHTAVTEVMFHQNVYKPGFKVGHLMDKEVYNISISPQ